MSKSTGVLKFGERAARDLSTRFGGLFDTESLLKGIGPTFRADGQVFLADDTKQLWKFDLSSTATAGDDCLVPTSGSGRFLRVAKKRSAPGADLTDASPTIVVTDGKWRRLPAATLSAPRTITIGTTGAVAGDELTITRIDATANTLTIVDGGSGTPTLLVMPNSKTGFVDMYFNGTNWIVIRSSLA